MKRTISFGLRTTLLATILLASTPVALAFEDDGRSSAVFSASHLFPFGVFDETFPGAATLLRTRHGLTMTSSVTGLTPGAVYTVWWIIFNNPDACENPLGEFSPCSDLDFPNPQVAAAIIWAAGAIADDSGTARFTGYLKRGRPPQGIFVAPVGAGKLKHPMKAEVHLVFAEHPGAVELAEMGMVDLALTTPFGGCGGPCPQTIATIFSPPE